MTDPIFFTSPMNNVTYSNKPKMMRTAVKMLMILFKVAERVQFLSLNF